MKTCAVIVLDFSKPHELMNQAKKWIKTLRDFVLKIRSELDMQTQEEMTQKIVENFKMYTAP